MELDNLKVRKLNDKLIKYILPPIHTLYFQIIYVVNYVRAYETTFEKNLEASTSKSVKLIS